MSHALHPDYAITCWIIAGRAPPHGNWTALISLGIPKLVRFHKIRPNSAIWHYYTSVLGTATTSALLRGQGGAAASRARRLGVGDRALAHHNPRPPARPVLPRRREGAPRQFPD